MRFLDFILFGSTDDPQTYDEHRRRERIRQNVAFAFFLVFFASVVLFLLWMLAQHSFHESELVEILKAL